MQVRALTWGPADAPIALCLHGFPDTAYTWRKVAPPLVDAGWRVVAPFMRGYAPTSVPSDGSYHVGALMDDALRVLDAAGPTGRDVFIGHDWGAIAGAGLAAMPDSPFTKAVIMSVPLSAACRPLGRVPRSAGLAAKLPRQLLHSWYIIYFQLPWLPNRSTSWVVPKLWGDWLPGYRADQDPAHAIRRTAPALAVGAPTAGPLSARHGRRQFRGLHAMDRAGVARRNRARARRKRRTHPAARSARCCRAAHRRLRGTGLMSELGLLGRRATTSSARDGCAR
jgi:pimeloyl-ACP methyl ester carboxylesterase